MSAETADISDYYRAKIALNTFSCICFFTGKIGANHRLLSNDNGSSITGQRRKVSLYSQQ